MAKHKPDNPSQPDSGERPLSKPSDRFMRFAILVGVFLLVVISGLNLYETRRQRTELNDRIAQLATPTKPATPAPTRPTGPDPNKVHTVKMDGAPFLGPSNAPVTIAEFSEFQ